MSKVLCPTVVGRGPELHALRTALAAAGVRCGSVALITGEAGIGKSRLAAEVAREARARTMPVLVGRATPAGANTPYRPLTEVLLQGLRDRPLPDDSGMARWLSALRAIVPTIPSSPDDPGTEHPPAVRGEAVLQLLRRLAGAMPLLVVLEDLHWADPDTLAVLEYLVDNVGAQPILCIATCRLEPASAASDLVHRLDGTRVSVHLSLDRLSADEVTSMVRTCLPTADEEVVSRVASTSEGIPFLVEEMLATPGVPRSFAEGVRRRVAALGDDERTVLDTAALLGRRFDWRLLARCTLLDDAAIEVALQHAADKQLLVVDEGTYRFRHMLTRDAVIAGLPPRRRAVLARGALAAVEAAHPELPGAWSDLGAELAVEAGEPMRAGRLLLESGRRAVGQGALATAAQVLRRAAGLLPSGPDREDADRLLVEALALAGHIEEAIAVAEGLIGGAPPAPGQAARHAAVHLVLAHAAVEATRWVVAQRHTTVADGLLSIDASPELMARVAVLRGELAIVENDLPAALALAERALEEPATGADVRCHAFELVGRIHRGHDLDSARRAFEQALAVADEAKLPLWRLRALHELGTIDMFDHAGSERLARARDAAVALGAASTTAVIDLQLTAASIFRFEVDEAEQHAADSLATSTRLGLNHVEAIAHVFLGEVHALRRDADQMERQVARARAAAPGDAEVEGSAVAGGRGMLALLSDDRRRAVSLIGEGVRILDKLPQQGPALYRGLWPLLLAADGDGRAAEAVDAARRVGLTVNRGNRGLLGYAEAILVGSAGDAERASELSTVADDDLCLYPVWSDLARLLAAEPAQAASWGQPRAWLERAAAVFAAHGLEALVRRCERLLARPRPSRWSAMGVTPREAEVLRLVREGLSNAEVAQRLHLSQRTVEKHVENLLRRTDSRSRTQLVAAAGPEHEAGDD